MGTDPNFERLSCPKLLIYLLRENLFALFSGGSGGLAPQPRRRRRKISAFYALDFACFLHHQVLLSKGLLKPVLKATLDFRAF